jgi:hypothetical protein
MSDLVLICVVALVALLASIISPLCAAYWFERELRRFIKNGYK